RAEISVRVMAIARHIYPSMLSAHTDSDFFGIENPKVKQLFGLVVLEGLKLKWRTKNLQKFHSYC
ncbi:MAG: hypothetical protein RMX26_11050, partial [Planktomarina sp.]|nr:hypothetical protein [Planktomarina sp.]